MIIYDSKTGNVARFMSKIPIKSYRIHDLKEVNEGYVLVTYTTNFGQVPNATKDFIHKFQDQLKAVVVSGNKNWGKLFGAAGHIISEEYNVPLLMKFELSGTDKDVQKFIEEVVVFDKLHRTK